MASRYQLFRRADILSGLSGTEADLQRRVRLIGKQNADKAFAAIFTRRRKGDLQTQKWAHHDEEEVEFIVAGRMVVQIGSSEEGVVSEFEAGAGDLFYIPAGMKHRADAVGDDLCIGLVFCPAAYDLATGQPFFLS
jgi:mannose-6-phosphate isomerase-like protein (cupin superfamily)